jgi:hypothetical protein
MLFCTGYDAVHHNQSHISVASRPLVYNIPFSEIRLKLALLIVTFRIVCGNLGIYVRLFPVQSADRVVHMQFDAKHVTSPVIQFPWVIHF